MLQVHFELYLVLMPPLRETFRATKRCDVDDDVIGRDSAEAICKLSIAYDFWLTLAPVLLIVNRFEHITFANIKKNSVVVDRNPVT